MYVIGISISQTLMKPSLDSLRPGKFTLKPANVFHQTASLYVNAIIRAVLLWVLLDQVNYLYIFLKFIM